MTPTEIRDVVERTMREQGQKLFKKLDRGIRRTTMDMRKGPKDWFPRDPDPGSAQR